MLAKVVAIFIANTLEKAFIRLFVACGLLTVTAGGGVRINPVFAAILILSNVLIWIATIGSFIVAIVDLIKHW